MIGHRNLVPAAPWRLALAVVIAGLLLWPVQQVRSDTVVFYLPNGHQVLPTRNVENQNYLPLLQVLNVVGTVGGLRERKNSLKVWFDDTQFEVRHGDRKVRLKGGAIKLQSPVELDNGQWLVPIEFVSSVLPLISSQPIAYHPGSNRVFVGGARPISFTARLEPIANGTRVALEFSSPVKVRTVSSNGKWIVYLGEHPVQPPDHLAQLQDANVSHVQFDDRDAVPKLIVTPTSAAVNFTTGEAEGGRVLRADVLKPGPVIAQQPATTQPQAPAPWECGP